MPWMSRSRSHHWTIEAASCGTSLRDHFGPPGVPFERLAVGRREEPGTPRDLAAGGDPLAGVAPGRVAAKGVDLDVPAQRRIEPRDFLDAEPGEVAGMEHRDRDGQHEGPSPHRRPRGEPPLDEHAREQGDSHRHRHVGQAEPVEPQQRSGEVWIIVHQQANRRPDEGNRQRADDESAKPAHTCQAGNARPALFLPGWAKHRPEHDQHLEPEQEVPAEIDPDAMARQSGSRRRSNWTWRRSRRPPRG